MWGVYVCMWGVYVCMNRCVYVCMYRCMGGGVCMYE